MQTLTLLFTKREDLFEVDSEEGSLLSRFLICDLIHIRSVLLPACPASRAILGQNDLDTDINPTHDSSRICKRRERANKLFTFANNYCL